MKFGSTPGVDRRWSARGACSRRNNWIDRWLSYGSTWSLNSLVKAELVPKLNRSDLDQLREALDQLKLDNSSEPIVIIMWVVAGVVHGGVLVGWLLVNGRRWVFGWLRPGR